jgi:hypothetical protein
LLLIGRHFDFSNLLKTSALKKENGDEKFM